MKARHAILVQGGVPADDRNPFGQCLGNQEAVKWVSVMQRKRRQKSGMSGFDVQDLEIIADDPPVNKVVVGGRKVELFQADFNCNLPIARRADENVIAGIFD